MSLVHIRFIKNNEDSISVKYNVESIDFNENGEWENIGSLVINKKDKDYIFEMSNKAVKNKMLPPEIYKEEEKDRNNLINYKYREYGCGAWSLKINSIGKKFISDNVYPDSFPDLF